MAKLMLAAAFLGAAAMSLPAEQARPVLVELFTSEGCSSCPPADALLEKLDRSQPVAGAEIIVLSEHVDYWNYIGWTDPYSSHAASERQELYARRFGIEGPYTPQMVVNGRTEFVGNDSGAALAAIRVAAKAKPGVGVRLAREGDKVMLEADALPAGTARKAHVFVAYAAEAGSSDVLRGENKGRRLRHVAMVKSLKEVGVVTGSKGFRGQVAVEAGMRVVAFVQESDNGPVWGAAMLGAGR